MDQKRLGLLTRTLKKAGLAFVDGAILIADERRFNAVSMWKRITTRMPSTTNSLEATHGHLNEAISRRNPFWGSMTLPYEAIPDKTMHFDAAFVHNFRTSLKRCKRRGHGVPADRMAEECAYFATSPEACTCGETIHLSSSYRTDVPCSHRFAMGALKPETPETNLQLRTSTTKMEFSETVFARNPQGDRTLEEVEWLTKYAYTQIKRFSHTKDKNGLLRYVKGLDVRGPSALDIPLSVHQFIARGISHFVGR
jgi:hypothetical protein